LDANQRRSLRQAQFAGKAPLAVEPIDLLDDADGSLFDATVTFVVVDERVDLFGNGENGLRLLDQGRLIGFGREQLQSAIEPQTTSSNTSRKGCATRQGSRGSSILAM
jgi:hypothetical protein